jgi:transcriptional regulator with XRE-family HTH domain
MIARACFRLTSPEAASYEQWMSSERTAQIAEGFAERLRSARQAAGLTIRGLAEKTGITHQSVVAYEAGRGGGVRLDIVAALADAVGVSASWLAFGRGPQHHPSETAMHAKPRDASALVAEHSVPGAGGWVAPSFDVIHMIRDLSAQLQGEGGFIEQSHLYLDPMSAANWCALSGQEDYSRIAGQTTPLHLAAEEITKSIGPDEARLDIIGLGCGDGKREVHLIQHLLERRQYQEIRLFLIDISQPLLSCAHKYATEHLAEHPEVQVFALQGNFHELPRYTHIFRSPSDAETRRRIFCMFGYTFGNLQNEVHFLRNSLLGYSPGDFLLLNVTLAVAPAHDAEQIHHTDSLLSGAIKGVWKKRQDQWLSGPISRYLQGVKSIEITPHLDTACCTIPGSYAVELRATVTTDDKKVRRFAMMYVKRYNSPKLVAALKELSWNAIEVWPYTDGRRELLLFQHL